MPVVPPAHQGQTETFDDLEDFLAESIQQAAERAAAKGERKHVDKARERIKRGEPQPDDAALLRAWAEKHEWKAVADVAFFTESTCSTCGTVDRAFSGFFTRQAHRVEATASRWVESPNTFPERPAEVVVRARLTPICWQCAGEFGWPVATPNLWKGN